MEYAIPWRRGHIRPYNSIPRINWDHPLASGLTTYVYDAGGVVVNLVNGGLGKLVTESGSTPATIGASKYGNSWKLADQGVGSGGGLHSSRIELPFLAPNLETPLGGAAGTYSFAIGIVFTSSTDLGCFFSICDSANDTIFAACTSAGGAGFAQSFFDNSGTNIISAAAFSAGKFSTVVGTSDATTAITQFLMDDSGYLESRTGTRTASMPASPLLPCIGDFTAGNLGGGGHGNSCVAQVFYGAYWYNRVLTASEAKQLADDPYCLLWYPEDDMMAQLVGFSIPPLVAPLMFPSRSIIKGPPRRYQASFTPPTVPAAGITTAALAALSNAASWISGKISGTVPLTAAAKGANATARAGMTPKALVSAIAKAASSAAATVSAKGALAAKLTAASRMAAGIAGTVPLSAKAAAASSVKGVIGFFSFLAGKISAASRAAGTIAGVTGLAGKAVGESAARAGLSARAALAALSDAASSARGTIAGKTALAARATAASFARLVPPGGLALVAAAFAKSYAKAGIAGTAVLSAASKAQSSAQGLILARLFVQGSARAASSARAAVSGTANVLGRAVAASSARGSSAYRVTLQGVSKAQSQLKGAVSGTLRLFGRIQAASSAMGSASGQLPIFALAAASKAASAARGAMQLFISSLRSATARGGRSAAPTSVSRSIDPTDQSRTVQPTDASRTAQPTDTTRTTKPRM